MSRISIGRTTCAEQCENISCPLLKDMADEFAGAMHEADLGYAIAEADQRVSDRVDQVHSLQRPLDGDPWLDDLEARQPGSKITMQQVRAYREITQKSVLEAEQTTQYAGKKLIQMEETKDGCQNGTGWVLRGLYHGIAYCRSNARLSPLHRIKIF